MYYTKHVFIIVNKGVQYIMIRLIAIDMDGTLLAPDHTVSERNIQAIRAAKEKGVEVVIATGRSYAEAYGPVGDAVRDLSYVCLNGADVRDESGNIISATYLPESDIAEITTTLENENIHYELYIDESIYTVNVEEQVQMFINLARSIGQTAPENDIRREVMGRVQQGFIRPVDSYDEMIRLQGHEIYKIFGVSAQSENLQRANARLQTMPSLAISSSGVQNIEINSINAQKGIAIEEYAKQKGISMKDVMVIGDSFNDVSMMKRAGHSVAMENAPDEIKALCTETTNKSDEDGVAVAIEKALKF